jgi:hypothetical protein
MSTLSSRKAWLVTAVALLPFFCAAVVVAQPSAVSSAPPAAAQAAVNPPGNGLQIPRGTILPIRLNHGFSAKTVRTGEAITGRVMQAVPLPNGSTIPEGAIVSGKILSVSAATSGAGETVSLEFNQVEFRHQKIAITAGLRALASFMQVQLAQVPAQSLGFGTPARWADTTQIGGDSVYGVGGDVTNRQNEVIGKALANGVLARANMRPDTPCRGALDGDDRLQAFWVFSSDACGVYGLRGVSIAHAGRTDPMGVVVLKAPAGQLKLHGGSGMLLRVVQ